MKDSRLMPGLGMCDKIRVRMKPEVPEREGKDTDRQA
jgi:hypothetical protein